MDRVRWEAAKCEALKQARLEQQEAEECKALGYIVDADIHLGRADTWKEIADLLENVIGGSLLDA